MVALATSTHPSFVASDLEVERDGPSYTVDTVEALRESLPEDDLYLIVGSDTFSEVRTWKEHGRILDICRVAVVHRPGQLRPADMPDIPSERVSWVEGAGLPISATDIRRRVRDGHSARYLVPDNVADYIMKRGLYR
jgi:nicotinate-nucleotide adenylyltransferase